MNSNVNIRKTPVWQGVESTILSGPKLSRSDLNIVIHTKAGDFNVIKVKEVQEKHDYSSDIYGSMFMTFSIGLGDYVYKLYPFRDSLEVSVKRIPKSENNTASNNSPVEASRYRAFMSLKVNTRITGDRVTQMGYQELNQTDLVEVNLELFDRNHEVLRAATTMGGIYPQSTPQQLISGLMIGESNKWIVDGAPAIANFNMVTPDNTSMITDPYIPSMKLGLIPTYVQEKLLGVYSSGIGTHYQRYEGKPSWWVYPLFNTDRFDEDVERVVFFAIPENELSGLDRSYRKEGKILYVVLTDKRSYSDDSQVSDLNAGVGVRIPSATGVFNGGAELEKTGMVADRARLNTEVANRQRLDGVYYAPSVEPSDNPFKYYSQLAAKQTSRLNVVWENSHPEYIYPAMPCKYIFMDQGQYRELKGIILGKYTVESLTGPIATSSSYQRNTSLGIALEYYDGEPEEQPTQKSPGTF